LVKQMPHHTFLFLASWFRAAYSSSRHFDICDVSAGLFQPLRLASSSLAFVLPCTPRRNGARQFDVRYLAGEAPVTPDRDDAEPCHDRRCADPVSGYLSVRHSMKKRLATFTSILFHLIVGLCTENMAQSTKVTIRMSSAVFLVLYTSYSSLFAANAANINSQTPN